MTPSKNKAESIDWAKIEEIRQRLVAAGPAIYFSEDVDALEADCRRGDALAADRALLEYERHELEWPQWVKDELRIRAEEKLGFRKKRQAPRGRYAGNFAQERRNRQNQLELIAAYEAAMGLKMKRKNAVKVIQMYLSKICGINFDCDSIPKIYAREKKKLTPDEEDWLHEHRLDTNELDLLLHYGNWKITD